MRADVDDFGRANYLIRPYVGGATAPRTAPRPQSGAYRLAAGSVAAMRLRFPAVEEALIGRRLDSKLAAEAGRLAAAAVAPIDDVRSTASYRSFVLERVVEQMTIDLAAG